MKLCPRGRVSCLRCFMPQPVMLVKESNKKTVYFLLIFNRGGAGKERSVAVGFLAG